MAGLKIDSVRITPNPVDAGTQMKLSVGVSSDDKLAFVGRYIGVYVNTNKKIVHTIAHVNDYVKEQ